MYVVCFICFHHPNVNGMGNEMVSVPWRFVGFHWSKKSMTYDAALVPRHRLHLAMLGFSGTGRKTES